MQSVLLRGFVPYLYLMYRYAESECIRDPSGSMHTTGGGVGQGMGDAAAVIDHIAGAAKIAGEVIFSLREGPHTAEAVYDGAAFAPDTVIDLLPANGAALMGQGMAPPSETATLRAGSLRVSS